MWGHVIGQGLDGDWQENLANESSLETLLNETGDYSNLQEAGEVSYEHSPQNGERNGTYGLMNDIENLEGNPVRHVDGQESLTCTMQMVGMKMEVTIICMKPLTCGMRTVACMKH